MCGIAPGGFDLNRITRRVSGVQRDHDFFGLRCDEIDSNVIRGEREPAATTIDQHGEFHFGGTAMIE